MALKYYFSTCAQSVIIYCVLFHVLRANLAATKTKLETNDFTNMTKDDILGDLLYTTALSYFAELDAMNYMQAKTMGVNIIRLPSESIFSFELDVATSFYDIPISVSAGGLAMDVDHNVHVVKPLHGDLEKPKQFMLVGGQNSSALEHSVPEQLFSTPENPAQGISAVKALQIANDQVIPIYTINQLNVNTIMPQLQIDADTKSDIKNAVNAGKEVTVSKTKITFNGWSGCGYIVVDKNTGAGAYMISGGMSGADIKVEKEYWSIFDTLFAVLGIKSEILRSFVKSEFFEAIGKKANIFVFFIELYQDLDKVLNDPNASTEQKAASSILIASVALLEIAVIFFAATVLVGATLAGWKLLAVGIFVTFMCNFIKENFLDWIRMLTWKRRPREIYV